MRIPVKYDPSIVLEADEEYGWADKDSFHLGFVCTHENAVVEPPCCNGTDCSCGGLSSISCECEELGFGLSNEDVERILGRNE
jgi:hypothetical protein